MISFSRFVAGATASAVLATIVHAVHAASMLDPSFGASGITRLGLAAGFEERVTTSAIQPDGKVLVAGSASSRGQIYAFVERFTTAGTLDPSFGNGGVQPLTTAQTNAAFPATIDTLADGKFLIATVLSNDTFTLTRLTAGGAIDPTFGIAGSISVTEHFSYSFGVPAIRVAVQSDGRLLVVTDASVTGGALGLRFRRFMPDGTPDATFGVNGVKVLAGLPNLFQFAWWRLAAAEPGGGLTLVANSQSGGFTYLALRVTAEGALDLTFAGLGYASGYEYGNPLDVPTMMVRGADGTYALLGRANASNGQSVNIVWKIEASGVRSAFAGGDHVVVGPTNDVFGAPAASQDGAVAALQDGAVAFVQGAGANVPLSQGGAGSVRFTVYEASGMPRASFGNNGSATIAVGGYQHPWPIGLHVDSAGRLIATGYANAQIICPAGPGPCNLKANDALLGSVSASGVARSDFGRGDGIAIWNNPAFSNERIDAIEVDAKGFIHVTGFTDASGPTTYMLSRLQPSGPPDPSFGVGGRVDTGIQIGPAGIARAVQQPDGATVVFNGVGLGSSASNPSVTVFRVDATGVRDKGFMPAAVTAGAGGTVGLRARPDGRVVYLTQDRRTTGTSTPYVLQQFLPDGSLDPSFGNNGRADFGVVPGGSLISDIALLEDGSIVTAILLGSKLSVSRFDARGAFIQSFGNFGTATFEVTDVEYQGATNARILPLVDGSFVVVGAVATPFSANPYRRLIHVVRFSASGAVIATHRLSMDTSGSIIGSVALPDGSVLIARVLEPSKATLARLLPDDQFDQAFGGERGLELGFTAISALALDASGRLIIGGQDLTSALVARYTLDAPVAGVAAVEFFNVNLGHYFVTANAAEQASIDAGAAGPGWRRTGFTFNIWVAESGVPIGALPVCRFYGTPGRGPNSHFYTVSASECAAVRQDSGWTYEGIAFYAYAPVNRTCTSAQQAISRVYNNRFAQNDSNHRYITNSSEYARMQSIGWLPEGVTLCGAPECGARDECVSVASCGCMRRARR